jgi:hypothetical protein
MVNRQSQSVLLAGNGGLIVTDSLGSNAQPVEITKGYALTQQPTTSVSYIH